MTLKQALAGSTYHIVNCNVSGKTRAKLDSLGLVRGEAITVLSSSFAGLIIEVKGSRLALSREIAEEREVV